MINCLLCKKNKANQTGSHIVPHFLLKRIENLDNNQKRDYELGFVIEEFNTDSYFGRSVPIEKLENTYGHLTDEEIEKNKHPLVVDNFFCTICENRFGKIEDQYAKTLEKKGKKIYDSSISAEFGLLFWASVIWRVSINRKSNFELTKAQNETLRRILNRYLKTDPSLINLHEMRKAKDFLKLSYRIIRCPDFSLTNTTHFVCHPKFNKPYSIIVDEFIIFFTFNMNYNDYLTKDFFGIQNEVFECPINSNNGNELVFPIEDDKLLKLNKLLIDHMASSRMVALNIFWDKVYDSLGFKEKTMPVQIKQEIFEELVSEEKKIGRKFTKENLFESTMKILQIHFPIINP